VNDGADRASWNEVTRRHRPPARRRQEHAQQKTQESQRVVNGKIFGARQNASLKSGIDIIRKAVVHVDNLSPECTEALLQDYLLSNDIQLLNCYRTNLGYDRMRRTR